MSDADQSVLAELRRRIDRQDAEIVALLARRVAIVREVIALKQAHAIPARLDDRVEAVVAHVREEAERRECPPDLAEHVWRTMIDWTIRFEEQHLQPALQPKAE